MDKEKLKKERMLMLQTFAEVYLRKNNMPPTKILFKSDDEYGKLSEEQAKILHFYLRDEYKKMGLDLETCIKRSGEEVVKGKLSDYEIKELISRADDMIYFIGNLLERKAALKKQSN